MDWTQYGYSTLTPFKPEDLKIFQEFISDKVKSIELSFTPSPRGSFRYNKKYFLFLFEICDLQILRME